MTLSGCTSDLASPDHSTAYTLALDQARSVWLDQDQHLNNWIEVISQHTTHPAGPFSVLTDSIRFVFAAIVSAYAQLGPHATHLATTVSANEWRLATADKVEAGLSSQTSCELLSK
jgi:hypothetical protein